MTPEQNPISPHPTPPQPPLNDGIQTLRHERVINPINPSVQPESVDTPPAAPQPLTETFVPTIVETNATQPVIPPSVGPIVTEIEIPPKKRSLVWLTIKSIIVGLIGLLFTASYFWAWGFDNLDAILKIATKSYSPIILADTAIATLILIVVHTIILRFILRTKYALRQAVFTILAVELIALASLTINAIYSYKLFGGYLVTQTAFAGIAAILGAAVFVLTLLASENTWKFKLSRPALATIILVGLVAGTFGLSQAYTGSVAAHAEATKKSDSQAAANAKSGIYNFDSNYQVFFPSDEAQKRFEVTSISVQDENKDYYFAQETSILLRDTANDRNLIKLIQMNVSSRKYDPPGYCTKPDEIVVPTNDFYAGKCYKIGSIDGVGDIYGRKEVNYEDGSSPPYNWFYLKHGSTLITLVDDSGVLGNSGANTIMNALAPISANDLLAKSKQIAQKTTDSSTPDKVLNFPLYAPTNTLGLVRSATYISNQSDPANSALSFKYDSGTTYSEKVFTVNEYKRPSSFVPPNCGGEYPGPGIQYKDCKLIGKTAAGHAIYGNGDSILTVYWCDFGETIISLSNIKTDGEALSVYESMVSTNLSSINLK